jgi:hypothetical protein
MFVQPQKKKLGMVSFPKIPMGQASMGKNSGMDAL